MERNTYAYAFFYLILLSEIKEGTVCKKRKRKRKRTFFETPCTFTYIVQDDNDENTLK